MCFWLSLWMPHVLNRFNAYHTSVHIHNISHLGIFVSTWGMERFAAEPRLLLVCPQSIREKDCLFATRLCLHDVLQYVPPITNGDTVNHCLNSGQSPNAFGIVRQTVAHGQVISALWMSRGGRGSSLLLQWCTSVMQLLKPPTTIWEKGRQWHLI